MPRKQRSKPEEEEEEDGEPYEVDEDGEEEEEEPKSAPARKAKKQKVTKPKKRKAAVVDDEADEDDDEEADRRPSAKAARFFDEEADVDDEEDDEEDDDEDMGDLIADDEIVGEEPTNYRAIHREIDRRDARSRGGDLFDEEQDPELLEQELKNRYSSQAYVGDEFDAETSAVTQQGLLPTKHDPKLWLVHCRPGLERTACMQLLQKSYNMHGEGSPLLIKSAVCLEHLKGYVYVEAEKESHVLDAIKGLRTMFSGKGATLVPLGEMVDAITPNRKAKVPLGPDSWVRVKAGLYKDDLAQVVEADMGAGRATIRVVPRLDYEQLASGERVPFGQKRDGIRPPAKPFSAEEAGRRGLDTEVKKDYSGESFVYIKSQKFKDGYQYKAISIKNLIMMDTAPQVDELQRFKMAEKAARDSSSLNEVEALLDALPGEGRSAKTRFAVGDKVVVTRGDLTGLAGRVDEVREDGRVLVRPTNSAITDQVDFDPDELRKTFEVGDHVSVLTGPHKGESGMTLRAEDGIVYIMSDTTKGELKVLAKDLTESKDVASTEVEMLGQYMLHDLVQLDANTAGVIVLVDRGAAKVLTTDGTPERPEVRVCSENDIKSKIRNKTSTTDGYNNQVTFGDSVTVVEGPWKGKSAVVEYVWRGYLFLKSRDFQDNGGFVCLRARTCKKRGGAAPTPGASGGSRGGNDHMAYVPMSPLHASVAQQPQAHQSPRSDGYSNGPRGGGYGGGGGGGGHGGGRGGGREGGYSGRSQHANARSTLVGAMVKVMRGSYMGYQGRVKHESATHVQLELDAINRVVTVGKDQLGGGSGQQHDRGQSDRGGPPRDSRYGGTPPNPYAPKTPMHTPMTPAWGSKTPMHPGSKTPMHPSMGTPSAPPRTPMHPGLSTPHHTPTHHMTPRHDAAEETAWSVSGNDDMSGYPSAPTPGGAYPSAPTPGGYTSAGGYPSAPTPGAYPSAPTPGGYPSAPTPGGYPSAPTPGGYPSAPTPGGYVSAPTPGGGYTSAPTPGAYGTAYTPFSPPADTPAAATPGGEHSMDAGTPGMAHTPGMPYGTGATPDLAGTPGGGYDAYTPAGTTPGTVPTPGMGNAFTPAYTPGATPGTPGGGYDAGGSTDDAGPPDLEGVLVELPDRRQAVVRACNPDGSVRLQPVAADNPSVSEGPEEDVAQAGLLAVVAPGKKDRIKVLRGEFRGSTGSLLSIDVADGIVKLGANVKIIEMHRLGRLV